MGANNLIGRAVASRSPVATYQLSADDIRRIRRHLSLNGFAVGPGFVPLFAGKAATFDNIVDRVRIVVFSAVPREQVAGVVQAEWSRIARQALSAPLPPPAPFTVSLSDIPSADGDSDKPDSLQSSVGWQGTWHLTHSGKFEHTIQVQLTQGDGPVQAVYQFAVNTTTGDVQAMVGAQWQSPSKTLVDKKLFNAVHAAVKASAFVQMIAGITNVGGNSPSGSLTLQVQAGAQVNVTLGPVNVSAQLGPTLTIQQGQTPGIDLNPAAAGGADQLPSGAYPPSYGITILQGRF